MYAPFCVIVYSIFILKHSTYNVNIYNIFFSMLFYFHALTSEFYHDILFI